MNGEKMIFLIDICIVNKILNKWVAARIIGKNPCFFQNFTFFWNQIVGFLCFFEYNSCKEREDIRDITLRFQEEVTHDR